MFRIIVKAFNLIKITCKAALLMVALLLSVATAYAGQVNLAWVASTSANVAGYDVVYGQTSGSYTAQMDAGNRTQYTVASLEDGKTYYFAVRAYNADRSLLSANSNEVSKQLPAVAPIASFSATGVTSGIAPLTVAFTNSSSGAAPLTYSWTFGDGSTSTAQNPSKVYTSAGTYTVILTVTGPGGTNTLTRTNYITVTNPQVAAPVASFSAAPTSGTAPLLVTLVDTSTGTITSRSWNLGDGTTSNAQSVSKTYTAGTYTVKLTVSNGAVSSTTTKTLSATAAAPVANFTVSPSSGVAPLPVTFANTSTGATSYSWNFGDGATSTLQNPPARTFANAGTYTVTLTATGPAGTPPSTQSQTISVAAARTGSGPIAAYNFEEASGTTVIDASGNGNHGTLGCNKTVNASCANAARTTSGKFGKAISFDGTDDWVTVNDSASLDLTTGMTLEAWVYPTATMSGWQSILTKEQPSSYMYMLYANSDANVPATAALFNNNEGALWGRSQLVPNTWAHLATTYDGAVQRFYVNGSEVANRSQSGSISISDGVLRIGGNSAWGEFFKGRIDEIRIYNRALSATEITTDMKTAVAISSPPKRLLGEEAVGSMTDSLPKGTAAAFLTTALKGMVTSLPVYVDTGSASTNLVAGLYADNNGRPGTRLATGTLSSPVVGWNKVLVPATAVTADAKYWVAILSKNGRLTFRDKVVTAQPRETASETSASTSLTSLPSTWSTGTISTNGPLSGYGAGY